MFKLFSESEVVKKKDFNGQSEFEERQMSLHSELLLKTLRVSLTNTPLLFSNLFLTL